MKVWLLLFATIAYAQQVRFNLLPQDVIEKRLGSYTTRNNTREPALRALFEEAGCKEGSLSEQPVKGTKSPNLICTLQGNSGSTIIVGAHFDLVEKGHGVVDNWSGASLLPSFYQGLAESARKHTIVFVAFAGEEQGLLGSQTYVKQLGDRKSEVRAMINLDTLGLGPTLIWLSHSDPMLADSLAAVAKQLDLPIAAMNIEQVGSSDSESFRQKKIPAMTVHSLTQDTLRILHTSSDKIEAVKVDDYYKTYKLLTIYLAALDQKLD